MVLDGLVGNMAQCNPLVHYVDIGGVSDHVFALFNFLGLCLMPRERDFPNRRLVCFGNPGRSKTLSPIMGKPVNEGVVPDHWGRGLAWGKRWAWRSIVEAVPTLNWLINIGAT